MSQLQVTGEAKIRDIQGPVVANSGVITALDGAASQYVRGDGTLADFPTSTGGGSSVSYYLNSSVSQGTIGGVAYRQLGKTPISGAGTDIVISANGYVASYITDANDPALLEVPAGNFNCEFYFSVNSNNHNPFVYAEVYKYDGTTFTLIGSSQSVPEYLTNGTTLSPYYFAIPVTQTTLAITDRIAIRIYVNVDTRVVTLHTENNHLCQVVTTFSKGLTSLNNLTRQVQFLGTGTSGTDFAISSSVATHTFNLPIASATNTGKLSSSDWSTFNNKQAALSFTAPLVNTSNTISIPAATSLVDGYLDNLDWTNFNTAYNNMIVSAAVTGTTTKTLTLTQQDAGTITASWTDDNTDAVTSVFGRTGAVVATSGDYNTSQVTENTNLYYTDARSRAALSFASGSGAYNSTTGVITIPTNNNQITNGSNFITLTSLSAGTGISYNNTTGVITNSAPDQTVSLTAGAGISISGTYPSFTIASTITQYTDALARAAISLTTTGTSGAATYNSTTGVFNIPNYAPDLSGYVPTSRTITINGTSFDLSANRSYSVGTVTSVGLSSATSGVTIGSTPITTSGTITLAIATASSSQNGLLSSTDWTTFNGKQAALNGTGFVKISGTTISYDNSTYLTTSAASSTYLPLAGGTLTGALTANTGINIGLSGTNDISWNTAGGIKLSRTNVGAEYALSQRWTGSLAYVDIASSSQWNGGVTILPNGGGNVGIGTSSPDRLFHINADTSTTTAIQKVQNVGTGDAVTEYRVTGTSWYVGIDNSDGDPFKIGQDPLGTTDRFVIKDGGNVLIGTTTDAGFKLQVNGEGRFYQPATTSSSYLRVENNRSRNAALRLTTTVGDYYLGVGIGADVNQFQIYDGNAGATRLTISSTGAATIFSDFSAYGTFGSFGQFHIAGRTDDNKKLVLGYNTSANVGFIQAMQNGTAYSPLLLNSTGGNVLIATTTDNGQGKLQVNGAITANNISYTGELVTTSTTFNATYYHIISGAVGSGQTYTLPSPSSNNLQYVVINKSNFSQTISAGSGFTIYNMAGSDVSSITLASKARCFIIADGSGFYQIF
jgi:hypothetical protein